MVSKDGSGEKADHGDAAGTRSRTFSHHDGIRVDLSGFHAVVEKVLPFFLSPR